MRSTYPSRLAAVLMFVCWWCGPLCPHNLFAAEPPAKESAEPTVTTVAAPLPKVRMSTSHGDIDIELYEDDAPNTVANFIELSEKHFFDGLKFHDVINNRWVQSGDPTGTGRGGPSYKFAHEINAESLGLDKIMVKDFVVRYKMTPPPGTEQLSLKDLYEKQGFHFVPNLKSHPVLKGALAMAYRTPDTNGSQFFIALNDCPWLDGKHTVFGHVTGGLEILKLVQKGDIVDKIEIVSKRDHPYHVKTLEEKSNTPQPQSQTQPQLEKPIVTEPHK